MFDRYDSPDMEDQPLTTYLRTYRQRTGFTQPEVAFLIGGMDGKVVSRHERGERRPALHTVLKYAFVLDVAIVELYEGLSAEIRAEICIRVRGLVRTTKRERQTARSDRKLESLNRIILKSGCGNSSG
jgi:transcriptional regulator with XRE-family HTH domain